MSIEMKRLSKSFKKGELALSKVDFTMQRGEVVGLVGPNGAGKTTLMKILSGIIVKYDGELSMGDQAKVGSLIEKPKFFPNRSGLYNINYFSALYGASNKQMDDIIESLGMASYLKKKVKHYSLGMKQRLGIALALISNPDYLILDEPTNGMDPDGIRNILQYVRELVKERNIGVLISSHILEDVENISDRVYVIKDGAFVNQYSRDREHEQVISLAFSEDEVHKAFSMLGNEESIKKQQNVISFIYDGDMKPILQHLGQEEIYPTDVKSKRATLEDFYFEQMRGEAK
ncbi:ABC transporter ATP-binding protein [Guptibacillus algicola]|uniref:ABC transporter ATP-binding protein n=1 Tax=Guptibacillus algicola TaxID=225844 RepID=UPI001CD38F7A|nr:ABC transporter ATP-binding protein [Alkalihalobacillus algicola]MCA0987331.1 ABC transporter ATP-binding protein [Alkalihalobacillus algicola]